MNKILLLLLCAFSANVYAQNVGIGTTTPQSKLHVQSTDTNMVRIENTSTLNIGVSNAIYFKTGSWFTGGIKHIGTGTNTSRTGFLGWASTNTNTLKEYMCITDAGNVGIGNIAPVQAGLTVDKKVGAVNAMFGSDTTGIALESSLPTIAFNSYYNGGRKFMSNGFGGLAGLNSTTGDFYIQTSNATGTPDAAATLLNRFNISSGGKVGVGGPSGGSMLEVRPVSGTADLMINAQVAGGDNAIIRLNKNGTANYSTLRFMNTGSYGWDLGTQGDDDFKLNYFPNNVTAMEVEKSNYHVAFGTNDFTEYLTSAGSMKAFGAITTTGSNGGFVFTDRSDNTYSGWNWYASGGTAKLYRYTTGGDLLAVNASGNLGIGTITPTLGKLVTRGTVGATAAIFGDNTTGVAIENNYPGIAFNTYYNGGRFFIANGYGGVIGLNPTNSRIAFSNSTTSGTAGAAASTVTDKMWIDADGTVSLGSSNLAAENTSLGTGYKLKIFGKAIAEEVRVQLRASWPDYVFQNDYHLMPLNEIENYIKENNHLPGFEKAAVVEKEGADLGETQRKLLEKIEELTLHMISINKRVEELEKENSALKNR
ncbi:MAG: hypothetical protein ABJA78_04045 [Ferruginibacter sp.]